MNIDNKSEQLIILLTRETFSGEVKWKNEQAPAGLVKGTEDYYPLFLKTVYKGTTIGLFQRRYKHFYDEFEFYWCEEIGMCVVGDYDAVVWEYKERSSALINLFEAAREQASGIGGILDNLLK
jgi:hypothetical protein